MADGDKKEMPFIMKALIIGIIAILVVVISIATSYYVATKFKTNRDDPKIVEKNKEEEKKEEKKEYGKTIEFGQYTINLKDENPIYLVVGIYFETEAKIKDKEKLKLEEEITSKKVIIEDKVLGILRNKTKQDINQDTNLINLKTEIKNAVNEIVSVGKIKDVRFNNWLVQ